jgi:hypothetical protein
VGETEQEDLLDFSQDYSMANPLEHDLVRISHQHAMRMSATRDENDESKLAGDENDLIDYQSDDLRPKKELGETPDSNLGGNPDSAVTKKLTGGSNIFGRGSRSSNHRATVVSQGAKLNTSKTVVDKVSIEKLEKDFEKRCQLILRSKKFEEEDWDNLETLSKDFL